MIFSRQPWLRVVTGVVLFIISVAVLHLRLQEDVDAAEYNDAQPMDNDVGDDDVGHDVVGHDVVGHDVVGHDVVEDGRESKIEALQLEIAQLQAQLATVKDVINAANNETETQVDEIRHLQDEHDVMTYASFTLKWIYVVNSASGRVLERLDGAKKQDIMQVILAATKKLYENGTFDKGSTRYKLAHGMYRTEALGTRYHLFFHEVDNQSIYKKITLYRPFSSLQIMSIRDADSQDEIVQIIVPLAGRVDVFRLFMDNFIAQCVQMKENVHLTIVYHGTDGLNEIEQIVKNVRTSYSFWNVVLLRKDGDFSRGGAIQYAVERLKETNSILFLCDVDIIFNREFLRRCRLNTEKGNRVYYPIVFSMYNPDVVYPLQDMKKPEREKELYEISPSNGFWRDSGYGMACIHRSDFLRLGGFNQETKGWGVEDLKLFRKLAQSNLAVERAVDNDIFHVWHGKKCDMMLPWKQFRACLTTRAVNEAPHGLLGLMAYKNEVKEYKKMHKMPLHDE